MAGERQGKRTHETARAKKRLFPIIPEELAVAILTGEIRASSGFFARHGDDDWTKV